MSRRRRDLIYALRVEALGEEVVPGQVDQLRYAMRLPDGDTSDLYRDVLVGIPEGIPSEIRWRSQDRGRAKIGGLAVVLNRTQQTLLNFYSIAPAPILAHLRSALEKAAATIELTEFAAGAGSLQGQIVVLEREAIYLETFVAESGGISTYDCQRGVLGTSATRHGIQAQDDTTLLGAERNPEPSYRRAELLQLERHQGYSDELVVGAGYVREIDLVTPQTLRISFDDGLERVRARQLCARLWKARRDRYTAPAEDGSTTGSASFSAEGRPDGGALIDGQTLYSIGGKFVIKADASASVGGTTLQLDARTRGFSLSDPLNFEELSKDAWECFSTAPDAPLLNGSAKATQNKLASNVFDLVLQILTSTDHQDNLHSGGDNGDWDTGIGQLGCSIPLADIDLESFEQIRALVPISPVQESILLGVDGKSTKALDFLQGVLVPYLAVLVQRQDGRLRLARFADAPTGLEVEITQPVLLSIDRQKRRLFDRFDHLDIEYGQRVDGDTLTQPYNNVVSLRRNLGSQNDEVLSAPGLSREVGRDLLTALGVTHVGLWQIEHPEWEITVLATDELVAVELGDAVLVSLDHIAGENAGQVGVGVSKALCLVTSRQHFFKTNQIRFRLLNVGVGYTRRGWYAPSARVLLVDGDRVILNPTWSDDPVEPGHDDDAFGFEPGQVVEITSRDRSTLRATLTVSEVEPSFIRFTVAVPGAVQVGDVVELAPYDQQTSDPLRDVWAWWATDAPFPPGPNVDGDTPFQWSL